LPATVSKSQGGSRWTAVISIVACVVILAGAGGVLWWIYGTEPTAQREGATRKSAALVETVTVSRGDYQPQIVVLGHVEPARDITLNPRVSGQITELDPAFVPGGIVGKGDRLLEIDPADFEIMVAMRRSDLHQAEADLAIERGRQDVARKEFELLGEEIGPGNRALVLREPQIESIKARVEAAEAALRQAELDLQRTTITAPFDAQLLTRAANVGSQVSPGDPLARLVGINEYWVVATVPLRHLPWISFAEDDEGSPVVLRNPDTWPPGAERQGRVTQLIGTVDEQTRLARVLVTVDDPLARDIDAPPLVIGTLIETRIQGRAIEDVVRLNRDYVRDGDTVWLMVDGQLAIRPLTIVFRDAEYAYVRDGLEDGDEVVTTTLATVVEGLDLRRMNQSPPQNDGAAP